MIRSILHTFIMTSSLVGFGWIPGVLSAAENASEIVLELAESVLLNNAEYTLGDVIVPKGSRGWRTMKHAADTLGRSPRPGQVAYITRRQIAARLEALSPGMHRLITWKGASAVKIHSVGISLSGARITEVAKSHLESLLSKEFERYTVLSVDDGQELVVPKGKVELSASFADVQRISRRTCIWVDVTIAGSHYQTVPVWFEVESFKTVWVTDVDRAQREYLVTEGLKQEQRDVALLAEPPLAINESMTGLRLTQSVVAGQVLTPKMVEKIPAVEKGEIVTVHAQSGRVHLSTRAVALSDGELAQKIAVQNPNKGESYTVVVVGRGEVSANGN